MLKRTLIIVAALTAPHTAKADAIYGCWTDGAETLVVEYSKVITPGGASPEAEIDRHSAVYMAPDGERDAGKVLAFRQLNDAQVARTVHAQTDGAAVGAREIWTICEQVNS